VTRIIAFAEAREGSTGAIAQKLFRGWRMQGAFATDRGASVLTARDAIGNRFEESLGEEVATRQSLVGRVCGHAVRNNGRGRGPQIKDRATGSGSPTELFCRRGAMLTRAAIEAERRRSPQCS
jgi:hypothetical protein